jgi:hypothetical protein
MSKRQKTIEADLKVESIIRKELPADTDGSVVCTRQELKDLVSAGKLSDFPAYRLISRWSDFHPLRATYRIPPEGVSDDQYKKEVEGVNVDIEVPETPTNQNKSSDLKISDDVEKIILESKPHKGKKICIECGAYVAARINKCDCGFNFSANKSKIKKIKNKIKEKKAIQDDPYRAGATVVLVPRGMIGESFLPIDHAKRILKRGDEHAFFMWSYAKTMTSRLNHSFWTHVDWNFIETHLKDAGVIDKDGNKRTKKVSNGRKRSKKRN